MNILTTTALGVDLLVMTVLGGVLAVIGVPRRENKSPLIWAFAILGTVAFALIILGAFQMDRTEAEASKGAADARVILQRMEDQNSDLRAVAEAEDSRLRVIGRGLPPRLSEEVASIHRNFERGMSEHLETTDAITTAMEEAQQ
jgi:hypothetical protein